MFPFHLFDSSSDESWSDEPDFSDPDLDSEDDDSELDDSERSFMNNSHWENSIDNLRPNAIESNRSQRVVPMSELYSSLERAFTGISSHDEDSNDDFLTEPSLVIDLTEADDVPTQQQSPPALILRPPKATPRTTGALIDLTLSDSD